MAVTATTPPRRFRLLVFDWDGTLADSTAIIAGCIQRACGDLGLPVPEETAAKFVIGLGLADALRTVAPTLAPDDYPRLSERYREHYLACDPDIPLFHGAREMLDALDARGFLLAIATGKSRAGLARALKQQRLDGRFFASRCADEGFPKPHPDMLLELMERCGVEPSETLMIGDTSHDLELARNAGASAVAVTYGAHAAAALAALDPLALVASIPELRTWLEANA
ncbi:MAG TPA: HAD-IA family hydrolase [Casimicrobiaceae bacterium]|nr:HAD-IA family hydrolase [Casimicrobiaceae bacterium]